MALIQVLAWTLMLASWIPSIAVELRLGLLILALPMFLYLCITKFIR